MASERGKNQGEDVDIDFLISSRKIMRTSVTKIFNDKDNFVNYDDVKLNTLKDRLSGIKVELSKINHLICLQRFSIDKNEANLNNEVDLCEKYDDKLHECLYRLNLAINILTPANNNNANAGADVVRPSKSLLKSPIAPLPVFNSEPGENWELFMRNFEATISKYNYTTYDQFLLLKQQVRGRALYLIDSLDPDDHTYGQAKQLLTTALASRPIQVGNVLKQLSEIRMTNNTEPFKYISQMRKIVQAAEQLKIEVKEILNYFFLNGLNEKFRNQLTLVTNNSKPTLDEFFDNFFEANDRYMQSNDQNKSQKSFPIRDSQQSDSKRTTAMALDVKVQNKSNPFEICPLCPGGGNNVHAINKCCKYTTPATKLARLEEINSCTKCISSDHYSKSCKFRFKKQCYYCKEWHFSFLCPKPKEKSDVNSKGNEVREKVQSNDKIAANARVGLVVTMCNWANYKSECILGTFTCSSGSAKLHGLRDSGSQNNFILEEKLSDLEYEVIDSDVSLLVDGINESRRYVSKLVKIKISMGDELRFIEAFTFPTIDINLKLNGLSTIANDFIAKGYTLADQGLQNVDSVKNIELILGADAAYCFRDQTIHFGSQSVFVNTQMGVMLIGNICRMLSDLEYLPYCESNIDNGLQPIIETQLKVAHSISPSICDIEGPSSSRSIVPDRITSSENYDVVNFVEKLNENALEQECDSYLNKDLIPENDDVELNNELVKYLLDNTSRTEDGRLIMPLLWNDKVKHLLSQNFNLAKNILFSNIKKYSKDKSKLNLMNDNILELEQAGIIERVPNIEQFIAENPSCSFLASMPIFKLSKETTKCRLVFLSNLSEQLKNNLTNISHNKAMHSGPCLNQKMTGTLMLLRFDQKLLVFDIQRAFCQIQLPLSDQNKLLFVWVRDTNNDNSVVAYRNVRLSFGLRPSPTILMVGLFKMLMLDVTDDEERLKLLKKHIYHLIYMDNGAITMNNSDELRWAYSELGKIFNPYGFQLQQFATNDRSLKPDIGDDNEETDLFGLKWDTISDKLSTKPKKLDPLAGTKRQILASIAENFDPYNLECPLFNRARLFMHSLQCRPDIGWDVRLQPGELKEWNNICRQLNNSPTLSVPRYVGDRNGNFNLIAFTDASCSIYGTVIYIQCITTGKVSFLMSKNRIVGKVMESRTIPALEFAAIVLGVETLMDVREQLCGRLSVDPITIVNLFVYSDSLIGLNWINHYTNLDKMNKKTVFIQNKLKKLDKLCEKHPVTFSFVDGFSNPSDCVTRPMSYQQLAKTNYLTGPKFLTSEDERISRADLLTVTLPANCYEARIGAAVLSPEVEKCVSNGPLLDHNKFSSWSKLVAVYRHVFTFISKIRNKLKNKNSDISPSSGNITRLASNQVLREMQYDAFPEVISYFGTASPRQKEMPNIVMQLNLFIDKDNLIRIGGKMNRAACNRKYFPILLPKDGHVTKLLILDAHEKLKHSGIYSVLSRLRSQFWIPSCFSTTKKILRRCIHCARYNNRTIKLNQSPYKEYRLEPSNVPFNNVFIDHAGPFFVKLNGQKSKVYILLITCLFTRAINLKISLDLSVTEFLRAFQLHSFEFGIPSLVLSDMGSSLVAGADLIANFLDDRDVRNYFERCNMKHLTFETYYKGCNKLGSLVESCVKLVKRLLSASIKNNILEFREFEFAVMEARQLVNKRPVAFKESIADNATIPSPITPEVLIYGHELCSINLIPPLQTVDILEADPDFQPVKNIRDSYEKLRKVRSNLLTHYNEEFLYKLLDQSIDEKSRYKKVTHNAIHVGDIVLLKEAFTKPSSYPMGRVKNVQVNDLGEITGATVYKGNTGEEVKRHSSCIIPILQRNECPNLSPRVSGTSEVEEVGPDPERTRPPSRKAAVRSKQRTKELLQH